MLAGVALACVPDRWSAGPAQAIRSAPALLLVALAGLGAASAAWTVAVPADALRWALVLFALAAVMVASSALQGPLRAAAVLLLVAVPAAAAGVIGAIGHLDRLGLDICGAWRPAGPLEYPPALALVCVSALPAAVAGMARTSGSRSAAFAATGWLLAATTALSGSRVAVALVAAALLAVAVLLPAVGPGPAPAAAAAVLAIAGLLTALLVGGELGDDSAATLIAAAAAGLMVAAGWPALRTRLAAGGGRLPWLAAVCVAGLAGLAGSTAAERVGGCAYAGFGHGRSGIWTAAAETARERPLAGHGLESFAAASRSRQLRERPAPVQYAHNLPLEAWVELGAAGLLLVAGLYGAVALAAVRATREAAALLGPAALAFLAANLLDWPWHLVGCGVLWAIAVGGLLGSQALVGRPPRRDDDRRDPAA